MPRPLPGLVGRRLDEVLFAVFLAAVVACLFRGSDLPSADVGAGGTTVSIGPADVLLLATAALALPRLRHLERRTSIGVVAVGIAFAVLMVASALRNGADALVAAGKPAEFAALMLGAVAFVDSRRRLQVLVAVIVCFAAVAVAWGVLGLLWSERGRQESFMGEHGFAALSTLAVAVGLARVHGRGGALGWLALAALAVGVIGATLGASLASLLGIYLVAIATLVIAARRRDLRRAGVVVTAVVAIVATAGTLGMRHGELGFLQSWFGPPPSRPGEYAASWSQRLIYSYVGGRVFLDQPWLGTGWYGLLPPKEFAQYLPDARERFSDQPPHYFPRPDRPFIPQQTYDQVLFELGLVGAAVFASLLALAAWRAAIVTRGRDANAAYLPAAWLAAAAAALAGEAMFGGAPVTAIFWLTLGLAAADPERS